MGYSQSTQINSEVRGFKSWQDEWLAECFELFNGAVSFALTRLFTHLTFKRAAAEMLKITTGTINSLL